MMRNSEEQPETLAQTLAKWLEAQGVVMIPLSDQAAFLRGRLAAIGWAGRDLSDEELIDAERELQGYLLHAESCLECVDPAKCTFTGRSPVLILRENELCYFVGSVCSVMAAKIDKEKAERILSASRIPSGCKRMTFENFDYRSRELVGMGYRAAMGLANALVEGQKPVGLYLCGDVGLGKTHLGISILNRLKREKITGGLYVTYADLLQTMRNRMDSGKREELENLVYNAPFLVLDDLGAEHVTDWVAEQLFRMINHRWMYRDELVTIVTSNLKPDALIRRIASKTGSSADGQRIVSRICEMCRLIEVQGDDYRMGRR